MILNKSKISIYTIAVAYPFMCCIVYEEFHIDNFSALKIEADASQGQFGKLSYSVMVMEPKVQDNLRSTCIMYTSYQCQQEINQCNTFS